MVGEREPFTVHGNDSPIMHKANDLDTDRLQGPSRRTEAESSPGQKPSFKLAFVMKKSNKQIWVNHKHGSNAPSRSKRSKKKVKSERREKEKQSLVSC